MTTISQYTATVEILTYIESKSLTSVSGVTMSITTHGLSTGDFIVNETRRSTSNLSAERGSRKVTVIDDNTLTIPSEIAGQTATDTIRLYHFVDYSNLIMNGTINISLRSEGQSSASFIVKANEVT